VKDEAGAADELGLSQTGFAIYGLLQQDRVLTTADSSSPTYNEANKELATLIEEAIEPHTGVVDWENKEDVQREMRRVMKRQLRAAQVPGDRIDQIVGSVLDLAKARKE